MMKMNILNKISLAVMVIASTYLTSCSLEEYNPSGYTLESVAASSVAGYQTLVNNCYFGWERRMYGYNTWMMLCEAGTDIWTYQKNGTSYSQFFKYGAGATVSLDMANDYWNCSYDGIGSCNTAISLASVAPFTTDSARNAMVAEAYFLRAMYYYNLVEQFGGVTLVTEPVETVDLHPEKTVPLTIYESEIIPDLVFAAKWLPITNDETRPTRKTALGFLARAYLQTIEYDNTKQYASNALEIAKELIDDCEAGGSTYGTYMYSTFNEVFDEGNNVDNKEAIWSHRFAEGGVSNNAWYMNMNNELFYGVVTDFGAMVQDYTTWGGRSGGSFMPTQYLLSLYVQSDGSIDPRYHESFQTRWYCNKAYTWTSANITTFDRSSNVTTSDSLVLNDLAIRFVLPNDTNYSALVASKRDQNYLLVDYADVYNDNTKAVNMTYTRSNDGKSTTNPFFGLYPSLTKHNSSNYYTVNAAKNRYGNLNATFMMRMAEVYLIAAEADIYVNGGANAMAYINKVRTRAGALSLTGTATVQTVLDERARELCGEYVRYYDLKRTGNLTYSYLDEKNPDVGQYFDDNVHKVRPIPATFLATLQGGGTYYQNTGY
jgi:starch-binding outer membrane protein, SusD/RagB family